MKITDIKNYRSNFEVFYTENGENGSVGFYSENYLNRDEPTTRDEEKECLTDEYDFDDESLEKLLNTMEQNEWISTTKIINYDGYNVKVVDWSGKYYIDFGTGLGYGIYPKEDWTLEAALEDQKNI